MTVKDQKKILNRVISRVWFKSVIGFIIIIIIGLFIPQNLEMPVKGAGEKDYHEKSFWYYPWGRSVTNKGVDIFA